MIREGFKGPRNCSRIIITPREAQVITKARRAYGWVNSEKKAGGSEQEARASWYAGLNHRCRGGSQTRPRPALSLLSWHRRADRLVRDGFFSAQASVSADLQLAEFFFAGWVALA